VEELLLSFNVRVHWISDAGQIEIHTADCSHFQVEIAIAKLKRYKSQGSNQIPAKQIE
jgi:hypothetical protein